MNLTEGRRLRLNTLESEAGTASQGYTLVRLGEETGVTTMFKRSVLLGVVVFGIGLLAGGRGLAQPGGEQSGSATPSRDLLDRYCVTCHNERLQTAELMLDRVDLAAVAANAVVLEKVVHKLRSGQMPPEGRPRPDDATIDAFATSLETALDRAAADRPNPGRVASRRLNRVEYVNVISDLLGLEIDGDELLPSDMAASV